MWAPGCLAGNRGAMARLQLQGALPRIHIAEGPSIALFTYSREGRDVFFCVYKTFSPLYHTDTSVRLCIIIKKKKRTPYPPFFFLSGIVLGPVEADCGGVCCYVLQAFGGRAWGVKGVPMPLG